MQIHVFERIHLAYDRLDIISHKGGRENQQAKAKRTKTHGCRLKQRGVIFKTESLP